MSRLKRFVYPGYYRSAGLKHRLRRLLTPSGWFVLVGLLMCGAIGVDTNQAMAYQTAALMGAALVVAAFWHVRRAPPLEFLRELPRYATAGSKFSYRVRIRNRTSNDLPGLSVFDDTGDPRPSLNQFLNTPEPGERKRNAFDRAFGFYRWLWLIQRNRHALASEVELPCLKAYSESEVTVELLPLRRGILWFDRAEIARRDPFGLARRISTVQARQSLIVLPRRYGIGPLALPGTLEYQKGGVALASSVGESEEFISLRDYRRGDSLRHIHWKSSARTGALVVKEFQDEFFARYAMVLDTFQQEHSPEVFEEAVSVAASFACTIQNQDSLLDLLFVGPDAYCFTAGRGVGQVEELLAVLASVQPCFDQPFSALDHLVSRHVAEVSGFICILQDWDEVRREFVRKIRATGVAVKVLVIVGSGKKVDPAAEQDRLDEFHVLEVGKVAEGLMQL